MPAFERRMASHTFSTASSCPMSLLWISASRCNTFERSDSFSFVTGIPVQRLMILAISSSVTLSCTSVLFSSFCASASASSSSFSTWGKSWYCNLEAFSYSPFCIAILTSACKSFFFSLKVCSLETAFFSFSHCAFWTLNLSRSSESSFWRATSLSFESWSSSFFSASSSICSCIIFLCCSSISSGMESISVLIMAQASSTRSIALSGRKRSEM